MKLYIVFFILLFFQSCFDEKKDNISQTYNQKNRNLFLINSQQYSPPQHSYTTKQELRKKIIAKLTKNGDQEGYKKDNNTYILIANGYYASNYEHNKDNSLLECRVTSFINALKNIAEFKNFEKFTIHDITLHLESSSIIKDFENKLDTNSIEMKLQNNTICLMKSIDEDEISSKSLSCPLDNVNKKIDSLVQEKKLLIETIAEKGDADLCLSLIRMKLE